MVSEMGECVLVVDDDREIVKAISILLEGEGYEVLKAYDGLQALDILASRQVRLVLMDVMMPRLDGLSAVMRIREKQNIPIIVLSAKSEDTDKVLGLSMGADDYVAKPYNPQELAARVKSHLRRYTCLGDINAGSRADEIKNGRLVYRTQERGAGEADRHGDQDCGPVYAQSGPYFSGGGDLPQGVGRGSFFLREHCDGAYPADPGEAGAESKRARIYKGGVGHWIQNGKTGKTQLAFLFSFWASA